MKLFQKTLTSKASLLYLLPIIVLLFSAYRASAPKENSTPTNIVPSKNIGTETYNIDTQKSTITWKCAMAIAEKGGHNGYVSLSKGKLILEKERLTGGTVEVDMSTIADEHHNTDNNLIDHLKGADFFDAPNFPTATFTITRIESAAGKSVNVTGDLTIKNITHPVTFPATIIVNGKVLTAYAKLSIDRTKWDVRYGSNAFFDNLADRAISDTIEFDMNIVANK